jgi:hypothetical protein
LYYAYHRYINLEYNKSRLTIKENWKFTWDSGGTPHGTTSPIKGYYIQVLRKPKDGSSFSAIKGLVGSTSNPTITKGSGTKAYIDRQSLSKEIVFDPAALGFVPGDYVKIKAAAYTQWGDGSWKDSGYAESGEYLVQNAGIVKIKVNTGTSEAPKMEWKEGQVWIKTLDANGNEVWREAETVYIKTLDENKKEVWKESQ